MSIPEQTDNLSMNHNSQEQLQAPGAGLPKLETAALSAFFKFGTLFMSDRSAIGLFKSESYQLLQFAEIGGESYDAREKALIPRLIGIEDSSRNWSVLMVLEHLCMTNRDMLIGVDSLVKGNIPDFTAKIQDYKPSRDVGFDVIERYRQMCEDYLCSIESLLRSHDNLRSSVRFEHPWFGPLDAHQWHCLAGVHQRVHRRQAQKIITMLRQA
jgi:hypothetical protein